MGTSVRVDTHEVVAMEVSTDDMHEVKALPGLVEEAEGNVRMARLYGNGASTALLLEGGPASSLLFLRGLMTGSIPLPLSLIHISEPTRPY